VLSTVKEAFVYAPATTAVLESAMVALPGVPLISMPLPSVRVVNGTEFSATAVITPF
jgi:hypothetical protein